MNEILTDKTGVLTHSPNMSVHHFYYSSRLHSTLKDLSLHVQDLILSGCSLNSNSHILVEATQLLLRVGNQTECALLAFVNQELRRLERVERSYEDYRKQAKVIKRIAFSSESKKMTVVVE